MPSPRIEELRRRLTSDPNSVAFAQLGEEHRRIGEYQAAVDVCRAGLARHPKYVSARVTLGRSLLALEQWESAEAELEAALAAAPDNLAAIRALADIHQRRAGSADLAGPHHDPVLAELQGWLTAILDDRAESR